MALSTRSSSGGSDLQRILDLHIDVYSQYHGYDKTFGEYVKETLDEIDRDLSDKEKFWLVEEDGRLIGCIAVIEREGNAAQVRWFLVHPDLRNKGIGGFLFEEAVCFIEEAGYNEAFLTTQNILEDAARIYKKFGFKLVWEGDEHIPWGSVCREQRYELWIETH